MSARLIVFAKLPVAGRVKTRLAATVGDARALEVHRRLLGATIALAERSGVDRLELRFDDAGAEPGSDAALLPASLAARGWIVGPQRGVDLGARMLEALEAALAAGDLPALIGSDCPVLVPADLQAAFRALDGADAVFAPAEDGGYALVGLARSLPRLFDAMPWGTGAVMTLTRTRLAELGVTAAMLRTVWDVDVEADLVRWEAAGAGGGPGMAPPQPPG